MPRVDPAVSAALVVAGWIAGFWSTRANDRRRRKEERSAELYKLIQEIKRVNSPNTRMHRALDIRSLSKFLGRWTDRRTERILDLWDQAAVMERTSIKGVIARQEAESRKAEILAKADTELDLLLRRLQRKGR